MLRLLPLLILLVASNVQAQTLGLVFENVTRGLSEATVTFDQSPGSIAAISILSTGGTLVHITDFDASEEGLRTRAMLPPAETIGIIFIGEARGGTTAWAIEHGSEGYTWVEEDPQIFDQTGRRVASEDELMGIRRMLNSVQRGEGLEAPRRIRISRKNVVVTF